MTLNESDLKYEKEAKQLMGGPIPTINQKSSKKPGVKYIAGRPVDRDEVERMDEIFRGLRKYVDMKMNKNVF